jgi:hypothetical protein
VFCLSNLNLCLTDSLGDSPLFRADRRRAARRKESFRRPASTMEFSMERGGGRAASAGTNAVATEQFGSSARRGFSRSPAQFLR